MHEHEGRERQEHKTVARIEERRRTEQHAGERVPTVSRGEGVAVARGDDCRRECVRVGVSGERGEGREQREERPGRARHARIGNGLAEEEPGLHRGPRRESRDDERRSELARNDPARRDQRGECVPLDLARPSRRIRDVHRHIGGLRRDADELLESRGVDRRVEVAVREAIRREQIEDLIAQRQRGRDAPGGDAAVSAEAEGEDEEWRRAEADRPPRRGDEPRGQDEDRGEADRVTRRGPERDEQKADEESHRGEGVVTE